MFSYSFVSKEFLLKNSLLISLLIFCFLSCRKEELSPQTETKETILLNHTFLNRDFSREVISSGFNLSGCTHAITGHPVITNAIAYLNTYGSANPTALTSFQTTHGTPLWQYSVMGFNTSSGDTSLMFTPMTNSTRDTIIATMLTYFGNNNQVSSIHMVSKKELLAEQAYPFFMEEGYIEDMLNMIAFNDGRIYCRSFNISNLINEGSLGLRITYTYCADYVDCVPYGVGATFGSEGDELTIRNPCPSGSSPGDDHTLCVEIDVPSTSSGGSGSSGGPGTGSGGHGGNGTGNGNGGNSNVTKPVDMAVVRSKFQSYLNARGLQSIPIAEFMAFLDQECVRKVHYAGGFAFDFCFESAIRNYMANKIKNSLGQFHPLLGIYSAQELSWQVPFSCMTSTNIGTCVIDAVIGNLCTEIGYSGNIGNAKTFLNNNMSALIEIASMRDAIDKGAEDVEAYYDALSITIDMNERGLIQGPYDQNHLDIINSHLSTPIPQPLLQYYIRYLTSECLKLKLEHPNWSDRKIYNEATRGAIQFGLDVLGLVPVCGELFDFANGCIYAYNGEGTQATYSFLSVIPVVGWFSAGYKFVRRTDKLVYKVVGQGSTEIITFGSANSKRFREVCGIAPGDKTKQGHHLICRGDAIIKHRAIQKAAKSTINEGFHIDEALNAIAVATVRNQPNHNTYNNRVIARLNAIPANLTPEQTHTVLNNLMTELRNLVKNNPQTHLNDLVF